MTLNDLPEIKIVRHARSIRLRLRVEPTQIRLTAPLFCSKKQIQNFIDQSEAWLVKTWQEQQQKQELQLQNRLFPTELKLFNLEQAIQITYQAQQKNFVFDHEGLRLSVSDRQPEQYLKGFVIAYAKHHLPIFLTQVSAETGLSFAQCTIRQPKTRWGSCTSKH
ncbi:MAG: YgjP-like metallopeptidase domain-containing protein, partial [Acinetobacter bohemicus]